LYLSDRILEQFHRYAWPGNVRELENVIQAIATLENEGIFYEKIGNHGHSGVFRQGKGRRAMADASTDRASNVLTRYTLKEVCKEAVRQAETNTILDVLSHTDWNRRQAAAVLKTSYRSLLTKIKEYRIRRGPAPLEEPNGETRQAARDAWTGYFEGTQRRSNGPRLDRANA
jgi:two-component system response regulator AtoC